MSSRFPASTLDGLRKVSGDGRGAGPSFFAMAFSDERVTVGRIQGEQGASGVAGWGMESTPKGRPGCRWNLPPRLLATGPRALESSGQVILKTWISENLKCWQVPRSPGSQRFRAIADAFGHSLSGGGRVCFIDIDYRDGG